MGLYNTISIMNTGINDSCRPEYAAVVKKDADDGSEVTMNLRSDDSFYSINERESVFGEGGTDYEKAYGCCITIVSSDERND